MGVDDAPVELQVKPEIESPSLASPANRDAEQSESISTGATAESGITSVSQSAATFVGSYESNSGLDSERQPEFAQPSEAPEPTLVGSTVSQESPTSSQPSPETPVTSKSESMTSENPNNPSRIEDDRTGFEIETLKRAFADNLFYIQGKFPEIATKNDFYMALAYTVRDRLLRRWLNSQQTYIQHGVKITCYLSAEFWWGPIWATT